MARPLFSFYIRAGTRPNIKGKKWSGHARLYRIPTFLEKHNPLEISKKVTLQVSFIAKSVDESQTHTKRYSVYVGVQHGFILCLRRVGAGLDVGAVQK